MHLLCKVWITLLKSSGGQGSDPSHCKIGGSSPPNYKVKVRTKIGELQIFTKLLVKF